jgi:putative ATP-dependent endonuclease of OLD family
MQFPVYRGKPVTIELDEIVVLVGPNNAGKSSILRAYEVVMQSGKAKYLDVDGFPNGVLPDADSERNMRSYTPSLEEAG